MDSAAVRGAPRPGTVYGVQVLRGLAACLVVLYHAGANLHDNAHFLTLHVPAFGAGGVDLFFLISGFVMMRTTRARWHEPTAWRVFLTKRLVRIVPLYWLLTAAKIALVLALPALFRNGSLLPWNAVASFLFIPAWDAEHTISPVISAGWTLCFEMFFYALFTLCLFLRREPRRFLTPILVAAALVGLFRTDGWGAAATLLDPLLLEFAAGIWIGALDTQVRRPASVVFVGLLAALACAALPLSDLVQATNWPGARVVLWGIPTAVLLACVVSLESLVAFWRVRLALLIGDASYSIYLTHVLVLPVLMRLLRPLAGGIGGEITGLMLLVIGSIAAGLVVYRLVEQPLLRLAQGLITGA
jgi:exopolysaccharide production protein ExoZ